MKDRNKMKLRSAGLDLTDLLFRPIRIGRTQRRIERDRPDAQPFREE